MKHKDCLPWLRQGHGCVLTIFLRQHSWVRGVRPEPWGALFNPFPRVLTQTRYDLLVLGEAPRALWT